MANTQQVGLRRYHDMEANNQCPVKQAMRDRIFDFLIRHHDDNQGIRLLSMPGVTWALEGMVADQYPRATFTCVEEDNAFLMRGIWNAPGGIYGVFHNDYGLKGLCNNRCVVICQKLSKLFEVGNRTVISLHDGGVVKKKNRILNNTAVWLDFNGTINAEVISALPGLVGFIDNTANTVPVVITVFRGRETEDYEIFVRDNGLQMRKSERADVITKLLNSSPSCRFSILDEVPYRSDCGSPMVNFMGVFRKVDGDNT